MFWIILVLSVLSVGANAQQRQPEGTRPDQMADFAVRSLTVTPEYPEPREPVQIRLEIQNRGAARASAQIGVFVNGQPLATHYLTIGQQAIQTVTVSWTPHTTGLHSISAVVDPKHLLIERNRIDNTAVTEVVVARRPPPAADLVVADVQTSAGRDRPTMLRVTIRNNGKVEASAPLLMQQGEARRVLLAGPVYPGKSSTIEIPWGADRKDPVNVEINPRFRSAERRAGNNVVSLEARSPVDLRVENLALHTATLQPDKRRNVTVTFRIVNDGRQSIARSFRSRIEPGTVDSNGTRPFFVTTTGLAAGGVAYVSHTIPNAPAQFVVTVVADVDRDISEPDEKNNTATINFKNPSPDIDRWVSIGPHRVTGSSAKGAGWNDATGRLSTIAIHPTSPETMYVAGNQSGVWKTTNGGADWEPITDALTTVRVAALALDPNNPARVFLVTPNEGVFRSDDSGTSWIKVSSLDLKAMVYVSSFSINPNNSNDMLVASEDGVYRSIDGGKTWGLKLNKGGKATGLIRRPTDSNTLYAALFHETESDIAGIYESVDAGETWFLKQGCPGGSLPAKDDNTLIHLAVSGTQLFASYQVKNPATFKLFRTRGEGCSFGGALDVSWQPGWSISGGNAAKLWRELSADPTNPRNVYLGGTFFWRSTNNGTSFTQTSGDTGPPNSAHVDHHKIVTDPVSPNVIYSLNDGGIFKSTNRGASGTWQFIGAGIANVEFYDFTSARTQPDLVIGGTQDNGNIKSVNGSTVWTMIRINDGATVDIDPTNANVVYSMEQYASSIERSTNSGTFPVNAAGGLPAGKACELLQFQIHPRFPTRLLASCNGLWETLNSGTSWSTVFTPATGTIERSTIDGPADVYYVGSSTGVITHRSSTFVATFWRRIFTHPNGLKVTDLELDLANRSVLYASFEGRFMGRIYRLVRSGDSPPAFTATDITSDLAFGPNVQALAVDRNHPFTIYAGTTKGVFRGRSVDGGATWSWVPYMNGLPPADVRDLEVHPVTGVMRAATHGRSAYEVNTDDPVGSVLSVRGRITLLRVHDVGSGFGPPHDPIDGEVIVTFDTAPLKAFGFKLRTDANEEDHRALLKALRDGLRTNRIVEVEYLRTGPSTGQVIRVIHVR